MDIGDQREQVTMQQPWGKTAVTRRSNRSALPDPGLFSFALLSTRQSQADGLIVCVSATRDTGWLAPKFVLDSNADLHVD